jgi:hypothetical protein
MIFGKDKYNLLKLEYDYGRFRFDDVLVHLIEHLENKALVQLS